MKDSLRTALALVTLVGFLTLGLGAVAQTEAEATVEVEIGFGLGIDRETRGLEGSAVEFAADTPQVFCLTRIRGLAAPAQVTHAWYHEGRTMARVDLNVGSGDWRTWSSKKLLPSWTGHWEVKVLDANGTVLASAGFDVK